MTLCFNCTNEAVEKLSVEGIDIPVCKTKNCGEKAEWILWKMQEDMVSIDDFESVKKAADKIFF